MDKTDRHAEICLKLNDTYKQKNHDYGDSFSDTYRKLGIVSAVTRITDKVNRLAALCTLPDSERRVKDEAIEDTLLDAANYCILTVMELEDEALRANNKDEQCRFVDTLKCFSCKYGHEDHGIINCRGDQYKDSKQS